MTEHRNAERSYIRSKRNISRVWRTQSTNREVALTDMLMTIGSGRRGVCRSPSCQEP